MADDTRQRNKNWVLSMRDGCLTSWDQVQLALLMDIRDELQKLNRVFECSRFLAIPEDLKAIRMNTRKPRKKAVKG